MNARSLVAESTLSFVDLAAQLAALYPSMREIDTVALGWTDSQLFDGKFISHKLKSRAPKRQAAVAEVSSNGEKLGEKSARELLQGWQANPSAAQQQLDHLHLLPERVLREDDFAGMDDADSAAAITQLFSGRRFHALIIGAGPVGAILASVLKRQLGDRVEVLLIESRVSAEHIKKPYERRWMTNIPVSLVRPLLHPAAGDICEQSGTEGYMGVDLCTLESLALLSAREAGVRCLFTAKSPMSWLPTENIHLLVDASGGRWREFPGAQEEVFPGLHLKHCRERAQGFGSYGLLRSDAIAGERIDVLKKGAWLYPLYKGKPCRQSMLKVSDIPIALHSPLMAFLSKNNRDNKFYLWPGRQAGDRKRLLLLVNLSSAEHEALQKFIDNEVSLQSLTQWPRFSSALDVRLQSLMKLIKKHEQRAANVRVARPFVMSPRMLDPDNPQESFKGVPVLSIGDSFFNGNPKSGNGLGVHLGHIGTVAEHMATAMQ